MSTLRRRCLLAADPQCAVEQSDVPNRRLGRFQVEVLLQRPGDAYRSALLAVPSYESQ